MNKNKSLVIKNEYSDCKLVSIKFTDADNKKYKALAYQDKSGNITGIINNSIIKL